ncbi:MAG: lysophospholipid acyltransferase family protein [bacterium]
MSSPRKVAPGGRKKRRRGKDKSPFRQNIEFYLAFSFLTLLRWTPFGICKALAALAGEAVFWVVPRRRNVALMNLRIAFPEMDEKERRKVARASCRSFVLTGLEGVKHLYRSRIEDAEREVHRVVEGVDALFERARKVHEKAGGCVFVIPHLGNWEFLSHASALARIPVTIVVRPLDNPRLEKYLFEMRATSGQEILAKRNALFHLRTALRKGRSIGLLADQHAGMQGIDVPFFGKPASTTTGPAALAVSFGRPIMLVACLRRRDGKGYEALLSEPIWPDLEAESVKEIERMTTAVNRGIENFIRERPEQYLWIHDRWKLTKLWGRSEEFLASRNEEKPS